MTAPPEQHMKRVAAQGDLAVPAVEGMRDGAHLSSQSPRRLVREGAEHALQDEEESVLDPVADGAVLQERVEP